VIAPSPSTQHMLKFATWTCIPNRTNRAYRNKENQGVHKMACNIASSKKHVRPGNPVKRKEYQREP
jgi:hypothetical protein